jgi:hypothetical protein
MVMKPSVKKLVGIFDHRPDSAKKIRKWCGFLNFFRRYICNYSSIMGEFEKLRYKKGKFNWNQNLEERFQIILKVLSKPPILSFPDFSSDENFILGCDASQNGLGGALFQGKKLISFNPRALKNFEIGYSIVKKELLSVV